jgi:uncharacterized protein (DUF1501 family)
MKRRSFLEKTALLSVPIILKGQPVFAGDNIMTPFFEKLANITVNNGKILVIVQLNGGNDGLNMVIPLDKYDQLAPVRSNVIVPQASVLPLTGTSNTGLHPSMTGLQAMYDSGKLSIVQGVGYPNPNFSHFRAQDILFSGANSNQSITTGWLGRSLNLTYADYPNGYPKAGFMDPPAIQIGGSLPLCLQGESINMGYTTASNAAFTNLINAVPEPAPNTDYGSELTFLRLMKDQSNAYAGRIKAAYDTPKALTSAKYPASGNALADQLKTIARLINGGLTTSIYIVNHPDSFDLHDNQTVAGANTTGKHANNLTKLSVAIDAFQDDLTLIGKAKDVVGMTFSEFGRRVMSNTSQGTDHGTAMPVIFFGDPDVINGGIIGNSVTLPSQITNNTQTNTQYDYRQLYTTVLEKWMGYNTADVQGNLLNGTYSTLEIFDAAAPLPLSGFQISASWEQGKAKIAFEVHDNTAYQQYVIERAAYSPSAKFENVGTISNTSDANNVKYQYLDPKINAPEIYYRVQAVAKSGKKVFSKIVVLESDTPAQKLSVYPNPVVGNTIHIDFFEKINGPVELRIVGTLGESLYYNQYQLSHERLLKVTVPPVFEKNTYYMMQITYGMKKVVEKLLFA